MADERKVLINIHSSENRAPSGSVLNYGEIAVSHNTKENAALYTKISDEVVAKFISEDAIDGKISAYTDDLIQIIQGLADISVTEVNGETPISATTAPIGVRQSGNTVTIYHEAGKTAQSGFKKLSSDAYGHITGGTDVEIGDISGLTGFQKAVRDVETKLTSGTTGSGNAVTDIQVNDHEITFVKGENFALSGHTHDASEIVSGVFDIARIPTAPVSSTASGTVATGEQIQQAIDNALTSTMNYKGATSTLPSTGVKKGDFYIADSQITIPAESSATQSAATAENGDYIIARTGGASATWDVVEKNLDGAVTSTGMTNEQIVIADGNGRAIKSVDPANILVGSATTAVSAITSVSAQTIDLSGVQNADDLKAIEALAGTEGVLKKTAANTWELVDVIDTVSDFSGLTENGSLVDAKVVKDVIVQNERITSAALNDLNDRINELSGATPSLETTLSVSGDSAITVTVGEETSNALVVPYAVSASTAVSALTIVNTVKTEAELSALTETGSYVDAKLIRDVIYDNEEVTSAALNNLNDRINELSGNSRPIIDTIEAFSGVSATGSLVDAKVVRDVIADNEEVVASSLNDLNDRIIAISGNTGNIEGRVADLEDGLGDAFDAIGEVNNRVDDLEDAICGLTFSNYASAITINGTQHVVVDNGVDLGDYLSASTKVRINNTDVSLNNEGKFDLGSFLSASTAHITTIQQTSTVSAVTTTINYVTENGSASAATITQDLIIDCGTY